MVTPNYLRAKIREALHLGETPQRTAVAFALGVFIAFTPTYGLHTASVVFLAWAFRLNFPAILVGSLINNPWTVVPILGATMWTGFFLLGIQDVPDVSWSHLSITTLYETVLPFILPFTLGALTLSILGALLAYPLGLLVITRYRRRPFV
ncbi:MAG: DUF2062 domain-containing protein [Nitrospira sp. SB0672_bin_25]|nr:DUF2062 domain-containing protein [Nitrospira sp. SB0666_bin_27]MYF24820.1 DUF2062 domain-containing protein [Nitrospira sp. SB0678_bin_10]MYJ53725.1 DUF2062 domain-containing protein [Nitrospira sp. SB0672_bin_25]